MSSSNKSALKKQRSNSNTKLRRCSSVLCCTGCRYSVSSLEDAEVPDQSATISSLAHAMVQAKLEQMIKERMVMAEYSRNEERMMRKKKMKNKEKIDGNSKCIIMVAMDKYSYNLREDFRESMVEVIMTNRIDEPKDLRRLLDCYVSMNSIEYKPVILQVFHETNEKKMNLRKIPEQAILSEVRRMVEEMQTLNQKLEETEAAIEEYFKPLDKEAEIIMNMQLDGEEKNMRKMVKVMQEQALLEKASAEEKPAKVSSVDTYQHTQDKASKSTSQG